jgi:hypothetical protein
VQLPQAVHVEPSAEERTFIATVVVVGVVDVHDIVVKTVARARSIVAEVNVPDDA